MSDESNNSINAQELSNSIDAKFGEGIYGTQHSRDIEAEGQVEEETNEVEVSEEPAQKDEFSSKFAALSRREKELRNRERQIEQKIAEFEARMEQLSAPKEEPKQPEVPLDYKFKRDPLKTLEELGYSYEDLTNMVLNDGKMSVEMQMKLMREEIEKDYRSKYEQIEQKLLEKEKAEEEAKYTSTIENFKREIADYVTSNEAYELIQANDAFDLVYDVIEQYYQENGRILETSEAADQVEQYLEEEAQRLFEKSSKLKSRLTSASAPAAPQKRQSPTLSNSQSVSGNQSLSADSLLTREESIAKLANQIKWID